MLYPRVKKDSFEPWVDDDVGIVVDDGRDEPDGAGVVPGSTPGEAHVAELDRTSWREKCKSYLGSNVTHKRLWYVSTT